MPDNNTLIFKDALFDQDRFKVQADYWQEVLTGETQPLDLPGMTPDAQNKKETAVREDRDEKSFSLSTALCKTLLRLSKDRDLTLYIVLLTAFKVLLTRLCREDILWIGSPLLNPDKQIDKQKIYNRRVLFCDRRDTGKTFKELLLETKTNAMGAYKNQDYPLDLAFKKAAIQPEISRNLERTFFLLNGLHDPEDISDIPFYWSYIFKREGENIFLSIEFDPTIFRSDTIESLGNRYLHVLEQCTAEMDTPVRSLDILTIDEKNTLLNRFNDTHLELPSDLTLHGWFESQVLHTPDADAVVDYKSSSSHWSYSQLNTHANRFSHLLLKNGVVPGCVVALMMEPGVEFIAALLAILKCGAIYMPIDPSVPAQRIALLLKDSNARLLITRGSVVENISFNTLTRIYQIPVTPRLTAPRSPVEHLDHLQMPDRSWVDYSKYRSFIGQAMMKNCLTVQFSRGCVYKCAYCFKVTCGNYHARSAEDMFKEIKFHYDLGMRRFAFVDDLPNLHIEESSKLYRMIIQHGLDVQLHYVNGIRADILTHDYIDLMVEAGAIVMDLALETTSKRLQKLIRKNLNVEKFHNNIQYIIENHPHVILETAILHGIPTETEEEALASLEYLKSLKWVHFPYIHLLKIYPNTEMEQVAVNNGISREAIRRSSTMAYHEIPETIPFTETFTRQYQADFLSQYFLNKERLLSVLPAQMKVFTEDELVQAYNGYLPVEIDSFEGFLNYAGIDRSQLSGQFLPDDYGIIKDIDYIYKKNFPSKSPSAGAMKILLIDLTQSFSAEAGQVYDVVEPPLGLMYVMSHLHRQLGDRIHGMILKSRIDFDSFDALKSEVLDFNPDIIGIRSLNYYADFFHKTVSLLRMWGCQQPLVAGGPYASSSYDVLLKDSNVDLAVIGEGEETFLQLIQEIMATDCFKSLPPESVLETIPGLAFVAESECRIHDLCQVMFVEEIEHRLSKAPGQNPQLSCTPTDPAYIIYTSGSTGTPKGVLVRHENLINQLHGLHQVFNQTGQEKPRFILLTAITFDVSLMHIFSPLTSGAPLYIVDEELKKEPVRLWTFIFENHITILNTVPAFMENLLQVLNQDILEKPVILDYLFIGGEAFPQSLYRTIQSCPYLDAVQIINIYGPTETTINAAMYHCEGDIETSVIPIGKPLPNYTFYLLDQDLNLLPPGIAGELFIGGKGVSSGYLNNPELTAQSFIASQSLSTLPLPLYRTGDLVRWQPDGNLEFLGRIDRQVKIRGFRIELGEIKSRIKQHDRVSDAVVVAGRSGDDSYLSAYYVAHQPLLPEIWPSIGEYFIWDELMYYAMTHDERRNIRFRAAVERFVQNKTVVEAGTGRDAILARFCAEAGAKKVYAVELVEEAAIHARETVKKLGLDHIIQVIHGDITKVRLPEAVDICIANQCGTVGSSEGAIVIHNNARRFLKEENRVIPSSCQTKMAAVRLPRHLRRNRGFNALPARYVEKIFTEVGRTFDLRLCIKNFPISHVVSDEAVFEDLDFMTVIPDESNHNVTLTISQDAVIDGFLLWLNLYTFQSPEGLMDTLADEYVWLPLYIPVFYPGVEVTAGDTIAVECIRTLGDNGFSPDYRVRGVLNRKRGGEVAFDYSFPRISETADSHPYYQSLFQDNGDERRIIYLSEESRTLTPTMLRQYLEARLPDYMTPAYFVAIDKLPRTAAGKIDIQALPDPLKQSLDSGPYAAPRNQVEEKLVEIWHTVLYGDNHSDQFPAPGIHDNFFLLGGHSLKATILSSYIHKAFDVQVPVAQLFRTPTIAGLSPVIAGTKEERYHSVQPVEEREYYELSNAQRRLWIICQFEEESTAYNMPGAVVLHGDFQPFAFERAVKVLLERNESLRTVFIQVQGEPYQKILDMDQLLDSYYVTLDLTDITGSEDQEQKVKEYYTPFANRPFNLERGPLARFQIVRIHEDRWVLMINIHHIINDGWSDGLIHNQLITLYNAFAVNRPNPLSLPRFQYKDYTLWYNALVNNGGFKESETYWLEKFKDKPNGIELPLDHPRTSRQTFNGGVVSFAIDSQSAAAMKQFCNDHDVTLFMTMLGVFMVFLYRYSGQQDILVGAPSAGRKQPELQEMVGFLVNTLVYRLQVHPDLSMDQLIEIVKQETLLGIEHQDYPFDLLIDRLGLDRDLSRSPLFNVMFAHDNSGTQNRTLNLDGVSVQPYDYRNEFNMSVFDLILFLKEAGGDGDIEGEIMYNSDLFDASTIHRMTANYAALMSDAMLRPDTPVSRLKLLESNEYHTIVHQFNATHHSFPQTTIQEMVEHQIARTPDRVAVAGSNHCFISYAELNNRSNRLAHYLRKEHHVRSGEMVGICIDRSIEMIISILAIIKAGGGYVAIDPNYPQERVIHMLLDSRTRLLLIDRPRLDLFTGYKGNIIEINGDSDFFSDMSSANPENLTALSDIVYVIYTSGSTGTPNGAMLSQGILGNLIQWQREKTSIDSSLYCLQFTSVNFCVSFQEIFTTLSSGGQVHLIGDIERQDIDYLMDFLESHTIENLYLPFSYLNFLFNESSRWDRFRLHSLKHIITAGEQLKISAGMKRFLDANPELQLHNHYGSSEMHVVTSYTLNAASAALFPIPPAGAPIANTAIYILDEHGQVSPMGVWGELYVSGSAEVAGYINNDTLSREKLVQHNEFSQNGKRLYRSGDMGRWLPDGNIQLRGRKDTQVKIRGFRVETGEVESKILAVDRVRECAVEVKGDGLEKYLVAYVSLDNIDISEITTHLRGDLPQYMIPKFVVLDHLPLMPNGKVDREKLPEPKFHRDPLSILDADRLSQLLLDRQHNPISIDELNELSPEVLTETLVAFLGQQVMKEHYPGSEPLKIANIHFHTPEIIYDEYGDSTFSSDLNIVRTPYRQPILDFDSMPLVDRSTVDYQKYGDKIGLAMARHTMTIQATRGCPYQCLYCHKIWPKTHVVRSAENIFGEVKLYYDMGVRRFVFVDDIFNLDIKNSTRFFETVIKENIDVQFFFPNGLRSDLLTADYIDLMVEAGTVSLGLALETASPRLQKLIKKNMNLDKLRCTVDYFCQNHPGVILELFLMHGFPTESEAEAVKTLEFIEMSKWVDFPYFHILKIYPNSDMADFALKSGISHNAINRSAQMAFHQLPDTLPFDKSFTVNCQTRFLNDYFLNKERLLAKLPYQMKVLTEDEIVQKYNSYLPVEINDFSQLLDAAGIPEGDLTVSQSLPEECVRPLDLNIKLRSHFPPQAANVDALRVLLLDLSQLFPGSGSMLYDGVEPPLGLMTLWTYVKQELGQDVDGKIVKSGVDFISFQQLKEIIDQFQPHLIGMRTLTFYSGFFHQTASVVRGFGYSGPIVAGGPYATSDYQTLLADANFDLAVLSEGELTFTHLLQSMIANQKRLPDKAVLKTIAGLVFSATTKTKSTATPLATFVFGRSGQNIPVSFWRGRYSKLAPGSRHPENLLAVQFYPSLQCGTPSLDIQLLVTRTPQVGDYQSETAMDQTEQRLADIWRELLSTDGNVQSAPPVRPEDNFFELGGHSLKATRMVSRIHKVFDVKISLTDIFRLPTLADIASYIRQASKVTFIPLQPVEQRSFYDLSFSQRQLYLLHQLEPDSTAYNMPMAVILQGSIELDKIHSVCLQLIQRHESLRTAFLEHDGHPVQIVVPHEEIAFQISNPKWTGPLWPPHSSVVDDFVMSFQLSTPPLFRVALIHGNQQVNSESLLIIDMHHIISDGISMEIFVREFMEIYSGSALESLRIQYKDFSDWQNRCRINGMFKPHEEYWLKRFAGQIPVLTLPYDFERPMDMSLEGKAYYFDISADHSHKLSDLASSQGATLFMVLLALYNIFLSKISGSRDIIVGTVVSGRNHDDLQPVMGMFVNTLAMRHTIEPGQSFTAFLNRLKELTVSDFNHQDYPFEELVEKIGAERSANRNPLFDVMFAMQNKNLFSSDQLELESRRAGLTLLPYDYETGVSKFDLMLYAFEDGEGMRAFFEYSTLLFKVETISRLAGYFQRVIEHVVENPNISIGDISVIGKDEQENLLRQFRRRQGLKPEMAAEDLKRSTREDKAKQSEFDF